MESGNNIQEEQDGNECITSLWSLSRKTDMRRV